MTPRARVIAVGQPAAGDDGVGLAVLDDLRQRGAAADHDLVALGDPSALVEQLATAQPVILVDAALGATPGQVRVVDRQALARWPARPLSSHGVAVADAIAIARALHGHAMCPRLVLVAIVIAAPRGRGIGLSAEAAAAVRVAADRVLALAQPGADRRVRRRAS